MSVKDFEQGMVVGAKPYEEVYKKQEAAIRRVSEELGGKLDNIRVIMNEFVKDMDDLQRKKLYDLNPLPIDIKEFEQEEKEYLVAGLYTLASKCKNPNTSPFQKTFARSIQGYLGIKIPQIQIDLSKISSVNNITKQKAIMQVFMEYLFLEKEDFTFLTDYSDCFADFSVNEKDKEAILQTIANIYKAVDSLGFIEKYGYFPEIEKEVQDISIELKERVINSIVHIPEGKELKYYGEKISVEADIHCEGTLVFEKCIIIYHDDLKGKIRLGKDSNCRINNCTITRGKDPKINSEYFIYPTSNNDSHLLTIENSKLNNCWHLAGTSIIYNLRNCYIKFTEMRLDICYEILSSDYQCSSVIENCLIESELRTMASFGNVKSVLNSTFKNISNAIYRCYTINNCRFDNCSCIAYEVREGGNICDSLFINCYNGTGAFPELLKFETGSYNTSGKQEFVKRCQFIKCWGKLIGRLWGILEDCEFYNLVYEDGLSGGCIEMWGGDSNFGVDETVFKPSYIRNCKFDGIEYNNYKYSGDDWKKPNGFITCSMVEELLKKNTGLYIENCTFNNFHTKNNTDNIIRETNGSNSWGNIIVKLTNCTGLENINKEGKQAENIIIRYETGIGDPIGARLDESKIGVPDFDIKSVKIN